MNKEDRFKHPPAILDYFRRINAEVLNFRRAMVKEHRGAYYVEKTLIKINSDGSIEVSRKEHAPTKDEAELIKTALKDCEFPKSIDATESSCKNMIAATGRDPTMFFMLYNRSSAKVAMIQERVDVEDGTKWFRPHSLWSDNVWRELEPERKLPFWKPRESRGKAKIAVHEGAKPARFIDWMLNDRSPEARAAREAHPWSEELESYEHWGLIGGALAPQRSDYSEIKREQPIEVVYIGDNDWPGRYAIKEFSRHYGASMKAINFDERFKESFDLADPMPQKLFKNGRWIGPPMNQFMIAATHATEQYEVPSEGKGRPKTTTTLKREFMQEWYHTVSPEVFIHRSWPNRMMNANEFNSYVRPFSDIDDTARLVRADFANKSRIMHYLPGAPSGFYGTNQLGQFFNTYCEPPIKPAKKRKKGDDKPWLDFLENLIPEESDRVEVMKWCATLIARPGIKMTYGLLLVSEMQGVGKGTLGEKILAPLVGLDNVSFPSEKDVVESQFNSWIAHKRLAVVHEIYQGQSSKAYNNMKNIITDRYITVNKKHMATYEIENWLHVVACSNSMRALKLAFDDRRWYVPKISEEQRDVEYWTEFNDWLEKEGGLEIIAAWAEDWLAANGAVYPGANAPDSAAKREMIEESMSPGMILVADLLDAAKEANKNNGAVYITDAMLVQHIKNVIYEGRHSDRLEKPATLRNLAKRRGWFVGKERTKLLSEDGGRAFVIATTPELAMMGPEEIKLKGLQPFGIAM